MNEIAKTFECPSCGASLQAPGGAATMQCAYCGTSVVVPQDLRTSSTTNPGGAAPASLDFGQLMGEAIRMGQVVRLARGGMQAEALQLYRQNTGVEAGQAEKVIQAIISGNAPNPAMMGNEMANVGEAIAAARTTREMENRARRTRRSGGIGCSGTIALLIVAAVLIVAIQHSTGTAHDLLARLIAQLNLSGLIH
jgi:LSD1 subclass zinc finger protein